MIRDFRHRDGHNPTGTYWERRRDAVAADIAQDTGMRVSWSEKYE
jgi:hypothetical protein